MLTQILTKTIGNPQILKNNKTIYTALVHTDQSLDTELSKMETRIMLMNQYTPKFPLDYEMFMAVRIFCDLEFTTGNMIREQTKINLPSIFSQRQDIQQLKGKGKQFERVNFIITQSLNNEQIYKCLCFQEQTYSHIITKTPFIVEDEQFKQFMKINRISLVEQQKTFRDGFIYFQEQNPDKTIFLDIGPQQLATILDLIDLYVITTYSGDLEDKFKLGKMPSVEKVLESHNLIYQSEIFQEHQGFIQFSVFQNKRCQL